MVSLVPHEVPQATPLPVPQESVWGFNPCGIFCGITMYHSSTTALLCGILWYNFFSVVFPMVFLVPHEYHRLHFCSTTGLCVVLHYPCGIFCGIMQYHRNTTGIPHDIFVREEHWYFHRDGVHLSDEGCDLLMENFASAVRFALDL